MKEKINLGINKRIKLELKLNIKNQFELCEIKWSCRISSKWTKDNKGEIKKWFEIKWIGICNELVDVTNLK